MWYNFFPGGACLVLIQPTPSLQEKTNLIISFYYLKNKLLGDGSRTYINYYYIIKSIFFDSCIFRARKDQDAPILSFWLTKIKKWIRFIWTSSKYIIIHYSNNIMAVRRLRQSFQRFTDKTFCRFIHWKMFKKTLTSLFYLFNSQIFNKVESGSFKIYIINNNLLFIIWAILWP